MKTIGIFTDNELIVLRTAIDIINDYEKAGVTVTKQTRTKFDLYVDFSDGTKVEWIKPNLNSRGHKVQMVILTLALVLVRQLQILYFRVLWILIKSLKLS